MMSVSVTVFGPPAEADLQTRQLMEELRRLDIDRVEVTPSVMAEPGSKGIDPALITVGLALAGTVVTTLGAFLRAWVNRAADRKIVVKIPGRGSFEMTNADSSDRTAIIDKFFSDAADQPPP